MSCNLQLIGMNINGVGSPCQYTFLCLLLSNLFISISNGGPCLNF